jgi:hypothetical protein
VIILSNYSFINKKIFCNPIIRILTVTIMPFHFTIKKKPELKADKHEIGMNFHQSSMKEDYLRFTFNY